MRRKINPIILSFSLLPISIAPISFLSGCFKKNISCSSIKLNCELQEMHIHDTLTLIPTIEPINATNKSVVWKSSNESIATINEKGLVTAISYGNATIVCSSQENPNISAQCSIIVSSTDIIKVTSITIFSDKTEFNVGTTTQLSATVLPSNASNKEVTWTSNNTNIATVDEYGYVTGISAGTVTITCTAKDGSGVSNQISLTITKPNIPVTEVSIDQDEIKFTDAGETAQLSATVYPSNASDKTVTWSVADKSIASVSNTGLVTAKAKGSTSIICKSNSNPSIKDEITVTVGKVPVSSVTITPEYDDHLDVIIGSVAQLSAKIEPEDATDQTVIWSSSDTSILTISDTGLVKGLKAGTAEITCASHDNTSILDTLKVVVGAISVEEISICDGKFADNPLTINVGDTFELNATIKPSTATIKTVTWSIADQSIATVAKTGLVTALKEGLTEITCTANDGSEVNDKIYVNVTNITNNFSFINKTIANSNKSNAILIKKHKLL